MSIFWAVVPWGSDPSDTWIRWDSSLFLESAPEDLVGAEMVRVGPPQRPALQEELRVPVKEVADGDVLSFSFMQLAIILGRLKDPKNRPQPFDDAWATLSGLRPETQELTEVLLGRALLQLAARLALRALTQVDVSTALRFLASQQRQFLQAA